MIRLVARGDESFEPLVRSLCDRAAALPESIETAARTIIRDVRQRGDEAMRELTLRFEERTMDYLEIPKSQWHAEAARVSPEVRRALDHGVRRIRAFHERERYRSFEFEEA